MSYFTSETSTTESTPTTTTERTSTEDFVAEVVKEKGEKWSDPQVLAKGYANAQAMIAELEARVAAADKNDYAKQLLETLGKTQVPASEVTETASTVKEETTLDAESIESLIDKTLTTRERTRTKEQNLVTADAELVKLFGTEAQAQVDKRAQELGLSKDRLAEIAGESPTAFLTLLGQAPTKETNSVTTSSVNTAGIQETTGVRNQAYYTKLRRENRAQFMRPEVQSQMMKDATSQGAAFYN